MSQDKFSISAMFRWNNQTEEELHHYFELISAEKVKFFVVDAEVVQRAVTTMPDIIQKLAKIAKEHNIILRDAHATWGSRFCNGWSAMGNGNDLNELCSEARIVKHETALHRLGEAGVQTYVVHPGQLCSYDRTWFGHEEHFRTVAAKALERLLNTAEEERIVIGVENIFEPSTNAFEVTSLVQKFRSPWLGLCLDCGHANLMEPRPERDEKQYVGYIRRAWEPVGAINCIAGIPEMMCPDIITVHIHDNNGLTDEHKDLDGTGTIDWDRYAGIFARAPRLISLQSEVNSKFNDAHLIQTCRHLQELTDKVIAKRKMQNQFECGCL